jgi:shikimate dehydrogenase
MKIYGVMGKPIINSLSPDMHNAAFMHLGINAAYVRLASKNAQEGISSSYEIEIEGINVTSPYKEDILDVIDKCSRESYEIGAVNTILLKSGSDMLGYNTDIYGVHQALVQNASDPKDKTV